MRISDWSSDVCSSDLLVLLGEFTHAFQPLHIDAGEHAFEHDDRQEAFEEVDAGRRIVGGDFLGALACVRAGLFARHAVLAGSVFDRALRSEEHTSELQSLMRISYAVFCLKKKKNTSNSIKKQYYTSR